MTAPNTEPRTPTPLGSSELPRRASGGMTAPVGVSFVPDEAMVRLIRERDNLFLLHEALADVERATSLGARLRIFVDAIQKIGFGRVTMTLRDAEMNATEVVTAGLSEEMTAELRRAPAKGVVWRRRMEALAGMPALRIGGSYYLDARDPWVAGEFHDGLPSRQDPHGRPGWSPRDALLVPVRTPAGAVVATLVLDEPSDRARPTLARVRTVELFAQQMASILEHARLYEESQRERRRAEALADVARAVSGSLKIDEVVQLILRHAMALLHADGATLSLVRTTEGTRYLAVVAARGCAEPLQDYTLPTEGSLSGRALRGKAPVIANDVGTRDDAFNHYQSLSRVEKTLLVPLLSGDEAVGVLGVSNRADDFSDDDAMVLSRLADHVAVAISNARLFEEHRALADRYTRLVESAGDAIVTVDDRGRVTSVNQSLERCTGRLRSSLLGQPFTALFDARDESTARELLASTLDGERRRAEVRYRCVEGQPDAEIRSCSITSTPIVEAGRVTGALTIMREVTEEKRLSEQLMQQEKLAAVGQLVSGVAHELNNPLAGVMAFSQLLLGGELGEPGDELDERGALQTIYDEAKRAAKIVSNLLTFARQHTPERTLADLNRVVLDTLELRRYALRVRQIDVDLALDENLPLTWADPFQLQQVVLNLIANAEQALEEWPGERRIKIATAAVCRVGREQRDQREYGELLVLRVSDNGPGIPAEHLPRIFNPFFTTKPVGEGTGLGLSISDGIVREHGGRIRAEAGALGGATFLVEIPFVAPPEPDETQSRRATPAARHSQRVLIVDDEPSIRMAVTSYLRSYGHAVDTVGSGAEALALVGQRSYDAIVLDLRMPDMSGDDLYRELARRVPAAAKRVVFLTGDTQSESARGFLASTGRPMISKPFLLDDLAAALFAS